MRSVHAVCRVSNFSISNRNLFFLLLSFCPIVCVTECASVKNPVNSIVCLNFDAEIQQVYCKLGMQLFCTFKYPAFNNSKLQSIFSTINMSFFHKIFCIIVYDLGKKTENYPIDFEKCCDCILRHINISGCSSFDVFFNFRRNLLKYVKDFMFEIYDDMVEISAKLMMKYCESLPVNNAKKTNIQREQEHDLILKNFWPDLFQFIKDESVVSRETRCKIESLPKERINLCMLQLSKTRATTLLGAFLTVFTKNLNALARKIAIDAKFKGSKHCDLLHQELLHLEFNTLHVYLIEKVSESNEIITFDMLHSFATSYFLIRQSSCKAEEYHFVWRFVAGELCDNAHFLRDFVECAAKLELSAEAWLSITNLVFAFCMRKGIKLDALFDPPFFVSCPFGTLDVIDFFQKHHFAASLAGNEKITTDQDYLCLSKSFVRQKKKNPNRSVINSRGLMANQSSNTSKILPTGASSKIHPHICTPVSRVEEGSNGDYVYMLAEKAISTANASHSCFDSHDFLNTKVLPDKPKSQKKRVRFLDDLPE